MTRSADSLSICSTPQALFESAANLLIVRAKESIELAGRFSLVLSGGNTPKALYRLLASSTFRNRIDWRRVHFFWGDERFVPADHPDSNYRMTSESLLSTIEPPPENVHRIQTEAGGPEQVAAQYEREIRSFFGATDDSVPVFDLILLGLGDDGHTASLFPHSPALNNDKNLVAANYVAHMNVHRVTFTAKLINQAAAVFFLVSGGAKASPLKEVVEGTFRPQQYPAQLVRPLNGELRFLVDGEAASLLSKSP